MGITTVGNKYGGGKKKVDPIVVMKNGGESLTNPSSLSKSELVDYINSNFVENLKSVNFDFSFSETGFDYPMNGNSKDVTEKIINYYRTHADYDEKSLAENTFYSLDGWQIVRNDIDPETDEVYDTVELDELKNDNTYNYNYLGAVDLNYKLFYDDMFDTYFMLIHPHKGGDPRGNYSSGLILKGDDREELENKFYFTYIVGSANIHFKFNDDSEISFYSEQENDVFMFSPSDDDEVYGLADKLLKNFNDLSGSDADDFLLKIVEEYDINSSKMMSGGNVYGYEDTPKVYVQILGYPEGKWITITDFSDGDDVIEYIEDWMRELNEEKGGNREEYEFHDYEGYGKLSYSKGMGSSEFDDIIETYSEYDDSDFPYEVVDEYMKDNSISEYSDGISEMNEKYYGSYKSLSDWAYDMIQEGVYTPSIHDVYVTDTDKRIISGEESESKLDSMDDMEIIELAQREDEFEEEKESIERELNELQEKKSTLEDNIEDAEGDYYESILEEINDIDEQIDEIQEKLNSLESVFSERYKDEARSVIYDEVYDRLENNLSDFLEEYGYDNLNEVSFVRVDYDNIAKELKHDFSVFEHNGQYYIFNDYKNGGKVVHLGKPNKNYKYFVIELGSSKIVSGWEYKDDANDNRDELKKENPKLSFGVYTRDKAEIKFGLDTMTYRDWIDLKQLDSINNVSLTKQKGKFNYGGMTKDQRLKLSRNVSNKYRSSDTGSNRPITDKMKSGANWVKKQWEDADFGDGKGKARFYKKGGITTKSYDVYDNKRMLLNQANEVEHHSEELNKAVKKTDKVASWVVAKMERATTDLSDITHYLEGESKLEYGGMIKTKLGTFKLYNFDELSDSAKSNASYNLSKRNPDYKGRSPQVQDFWFQKNGVVWGKKSKSDKKIFANGGLAGKWILYTENEDGYYRKISEHNTYNGAKTAMSKAWNKYEFNNLGIINEDEFNENYAPYSFQIGGQIGQDQLDKNNDCIDVFVTFVSSIVNVKYAFTDHENDRLVFVLNEEPTIDEIGDMNEFIHVAEDDCKHVFESDVEFSVHNKTLTIKLIKGSYDVISLSDGGTIPDVDKMFHLPLEMVVYVPSTQDVDNVISVDEMDKRVNEVKTYLAEKFGGYTASEKLGGFVDSKGDLVNEEVVQVVSFATEKDYDKHKEELISKLSEWAKLWGQEAIGFEFEGDLFYVPQEIESMSKGGSIWIQDAVDRMKKNKRQGSFTKQSLRKGLTPVQFAQEVLENPSKYRLSTRRRAQFVKNANPDIF